MAGGILKCFSTHGTCAMVGISMGGKNSGLNLPRSLSSHAKALLCLPIIQCITFRSSFVRKSPVCALSICSFLSCVYLSLGTNSGGFLGNIGRPASGSPVISLSILYRSGKVPSTGLTFCATGLYFFARQSMLSSCVGGPYTSSTASVLFAIPLALTSWFKYLRNNHASSE